MIDLRSDTVTLPTEEMREAMRRAELGDDSRDGDPTVRLLEEKAAAMTGKEAAMLVASGTMSNLVCLLAHAQEGGEVLLDPESHILRSEMGGVARLAGLFHRVVPAQRGSLDVAALREMLSARLMPSRLATALVCVETTHNSAGVSSACAARNAATAPSTSASPMCRWVTRRSCVRVQVPARRPRAASALTHGPASAPVPARSTITMLLSTWRGSTRRRSSACKPSAMRRARR